MDVAVTGLDGTLHDRVAAALLPGTRLVPCSLDRLDGDAPGSFAAIILGPEIPLDAAMERVRAVDSTYPETPVVLVAEQDPAILREALKAGARDVWTPDVDQADLTESLTHVLEASRVLSRLVAARRPDQAAATNQVVAVLAAKGGVGQTVVATNLALGLTGDEDRSVAIVDLDLQFGDVNDALQLDPAHDLTDAVGALGNLPALKTLIADHPSGLHVLGAPRDLRDADSVEPAAVGHLIELVSSQFDVTVVDGSDGLSEYTLAALDHATSVVVVGTPDPFVVKDTRRLLRVLDQLLPAEVDRTFVLNHANARPGLRLREIESIVERDVDVEIPTTKAIATGLPRSRAILDAGRTERRAIQRLIAEFDREPTDEGGSRS